MSEELLIGTWIKSEPDQTGVYLIGPVNGKLAEIGWVNLDKNDDCFWAYYAIYTGSSSRLDVYEGHFETRIDAQYACEVVLESYGWDFGKLRKSILNIEGFIPFKLNV